MEKEKQAERKAKRHDSDSTGKTISDDIPSELPSQKSVSRGELVWKREGPSFRKALQLQQFHPSKKSSGVSVRKAEAPPLSSKSPKCGPKLTATSVLYS